MKKFVPLLLMFIMCMSFAVVGTGCDEKKNDTVTRACWETVDETVTFYPKGKHLKLLSCNDIADANTMLCLGVQHSEYQESQFRTICTDSRWVLTSYTKPHKYSPFAAKIGDVWVDRLKPITLELQTKHCPKGQDRQIWRPFTREEIEALRESGDYNPEDPADQGEWITIEAECKD